jgi:hypothetical protein
MRREIFELSGVPGSGRLTDDLLTLVGRDINRHPRLDTSPLSYSPGPVPGVHGKTGSDAEVDPRHRAEGIGGGKAVKRGDVATNYGDRRQEQPDVV